MPSQIISFRLGDNDIQVLQSHAKPGESLNQTAQRLLKAAMGIPISKSVDQMSTLSTEQLEKLDKLSNIPTRSEFHELKERVNDFRLSLLREIQNRDKGISLLAEQIAELTARFDATPQPEPVPEITQVPPKKGRARVKKEGIKKDLELDLEIDKDDKIPKSVWKDWQNVCGDNIDDLRVRWRDT